ncbi:endosialidase [Anaerotalea alkaliphila]|uniref:Endosialidase n=1 Tax=Anaerotalea alkaliphila TaxID=2662126 RepID=A0A7X5HVB7_9FIRM|nr:endosialidase [Anaerotalea alkaliphila]NDL67305.1 endosialidase [Anaerotalea alkaliphila]
MAGQNEIISVDDKGALHFGNHDAVEKQKLEGFEIQGDLYKVKTHNQVTRLEKNGRLLYESVPGTTVGDFILTEDGVRFTVQGSAEDAQITLELDADQEFEVWANGVDLGSAKSNLAGKVNISVDFESGLQTIEIKKL